MAVDFGPWLIKTAETELSCWKYYRECSFPSLLCCSDTCPIYTDTWYRNINTQTNRRLAMDFSTILHHIVGYLCHIGEIVFFDFSALIVVISGWFISQTINTHTHISFETNSVIFKTRSQKPFFLLKKSIFVNCS